MLVNSPVYMLRYGSPQCGVWRWLPRLPTNSNHPSPRPRRTLLERTCVRRSANAEHRKVHVFVPVAPETTRIASEFFLLGGFCSGLCFLKQHKNKGPRPTRPSLDLILCNDVATRFLPRLFHFHTSVPLPLPLSPLESRGHGARTIAWKRRRGGVFASKELPVCPTKPQNN